MKLFRFENDDGIGPYRGGASLYGSKRLTSILNYVFNLHSKGEYHPAPAQEGIPNGYCFTRSVSELLTWFEGSVVALYQSGYRICEYSIDEKLVKQGVKQCTVADDIIENNRYTKRVVFEKLPKLITKEIPWKQQALQNSTTAILIAS